MSYRNLKNHIKSLKTDVYSNTGRLSKGITVLRGFGNKSRDSRRCSRSPNYCGGKLSDRNNFT
jgi:hypothetical protein